MFKKRKKLTAVAITAIVFGISFLVYGASLVYASENITTKFQQEPIEISLEGLITLDMRGSGSIHDSTKRVLISFETLEVFAGDTIEITASAPYASKNIKLISVIVGDRSFYFGDDVGKILRNMDIIPENIIRLSPDTDPPFRTSKNIQFFRPNQEVIIYAISFGEQSTLAKFKSDVAFTVNSRVEKLQVQTNNAILEQINEQKKTNQIFLGLTWIGIAVIPILAGVDILLRIHFET